MGPAGGGGGGGGGGGDVEWRDDLVDPEGGRPGLQLVHAQLLHLRETRLAHVMTQVEPGIMAQQDLASIRRITQLLGQQKAWPTEHPVLCDQMQPVGKVRSVELCMVARHKGLSQKPGPLNTLWCVG